MVQRIREKAPLEKARVNKETSARQGGLEMRATGEEEIVQSGWNKGGYKRTIAHGGSQYKKP